MIHHRCLILSESTKNQDLTVQHSIATVTFQFLPTCPTLLCSPEHVSLHPYKLLIPVPIDLTGLKYRKPAIDTLQPELPLYLLGTRIAKQPVGTLPTYREVWLFSGRLYHTRLRRKVSGRR